MGFAVTAIRWSGPAIREFEGALDYIARDNRDAADRLARAIHRAVGRLRAYPDSGRMVPELEDPTLREVVHSPFRVIYQRQQDLVEILAVVRAEQEADFVEIQIRAKKQN
jgi:plasmid stabilization system protein ParE